MALPGPPQLQLGTSTISKRLRDDVPPERMDLDVPPTRPYAVWIMFLVTAVIVILGVVAYSLGQ